MLAFNSRVFLHQVVLGVLVLATIISTLTVSFKTSSSIGFIETSAESSTEASKAISQVVHPTTNTTTTKAEYQYQQPPPPPAPGRTQEEEGVLTTITNINEEKREENTKAEQSEAEETALLNEELAAAKDELALLKSEREALLSHQHEASQASTTTSASSTINHNDASTTTTYAPDVSSYVYPNVMYGHVHVAKTGGTSINGMFANKFERVCGHKGYSYDAYTDNERAKRGKVKKYRVKPKQMNEIGYENCDYVSNEVNWEFWINKFDDSKFHGIQMELHVPCRERIDHLMSQCNFKKLDLDCDAPSDEYFFESVDKCFTFLKDRYQHDLKDHFDVKCFDFKKQFTTYTQYMSDKLQPRRLVSEPFIKRETNRPRNITHECIWEKPDLLEKTNAYLLDHVPYYQFCDACMGSEQEITREE